MTTLSTLPTYAAPNLDTQVIFTLTGGGANFVRAWLTAAPPGSELRKKLDASAQSRIAFYEGDGGALHPERRKFDVGGKYTLVAQEYTRGASNYGGGYQNSPDGAPSETKVGAEVTLSLYIGQRLTSDISTGTDVMTVAVWVWDSTIRATTLSTQGEDSPTLLATSGTPRAVAAAESSAVASALAALVNVTVSSAVGDAGDVLASLVGQWNSHLVEPGAHDTNDTDNDLPIGLGSSASAGSLAASVTEVVPYLRQHFTNDAVAGGSANGRDSAGYHVVSGNKANDNANLPLLAGASQLADAYWALADLCRCYEAHRVNAAVHTAVDGTNALDPRPQLMALGEAVLTVLASTSVATPPTQSSGAMTLISGAGFTESPL